MLQRGTILFRLLVLLIPLSSISMSTLDGNARVRLRDDCDPVTFNAIRPGLCVGNGDTTVAEFNAELAAKHSVDEWKFNPEGSTTMDAGQVITLESRAGETHTFTKVARFGGGFSARLNQLAGVPVPAPECAKTNADGTLSPQPPSATNIFVPGGSVLAGPRTGSTILPIGTHNFQCCIHPWMRVRITVRSHS